MKNKWQKVIIIIFSTCSLFSWLLAGDIDYQSKNFDTIAKDIDFVLDGIGGYVLVKSVKTFKEGGIIIVHPPFSP